MKRIGKFLCLFLSCLFVLCLTVPAYAGSGLSLSPASFVIDLITDACGISFKSGPGIIDTNAYSRALRDYAAAGGSYRDHAALDEYLHGRAKTGELGSYWEWKAGNDDFSSAVADFTPLVSAKFGDHVKLGSLPGDIRKFLETFPSYGTDSLMYSAPLPVPGAAYDTNIIPPGHVFLFRSHTFNKDFDSPFYIDYYCPDGDFLAYASDPSDPDSLYYVCRVVNGVLSGFSLPSVIVTNVNHNHLIVSNLTESSYIFSEDLELFRFPVFSSFELAQAYASSGSLDASGAVHSALSFPASAVNEDVQKAALTAFPDEIALPETREEASAVLAKIDGVMDKTDQLQSTLESVLANVGVIVGDLVTDYASEDAETAEKVDAASVAVPVPAALGEFTIPGLETVFPFCLPFDLIDFFSILQAPPEAPHFTFPFPYPTLHGMATYDFDVDFSPFEPVAEIFRTLETLGFIIGLIMITRSKMIRG